LKIGDSEPSLGSISKTQSCDLSQPKKKKKTHQTSETPATFQLNWGYCENGSGDPKPQEGASSFVGAYAEKPKRVGIPYILRKEGYSCTLPPEDHVFTSDFNEHEKKCRQAS
jgi:hypothetical protein